MYTRFQDEVIEQTVKELLEGADLETVTMKMICKQVTNNLHFSSFFSF